MFRQYQRSQLTFIVKRFKGIQLLKRSKVIRKKILRSKTLNEQHQQQNSNKQLHVRLNVLRDFGCMSSQFDRLCIHQFTVSFNFYIDQTH